MNLGKKAAAAVMAGLMAASAIAPAGIALAEQNHPSVGEQTGSGVTDLTMVVENKSERGGTDEPQIIENPNFDSSQPISPTNPQFIENPYYNPDQNNDGLGDNIAFTVPSAINYVVKADGSLVGPAQEVTYVENESVFGIEVSSVDVDEKDGFTIVSDATMTGTENAVDLQFGPTEDMLQASEYLEKKAVNDATKWRMDAAQPNLEPIPIPTPIPTPTPAPTPIPILQTDRVTIASEGNAANITADITNRTKFGQIRWYVQPSEALPVQTTSNIMLNGSQVNAALKQLAGDKPIINIVTAKGEPDTTNGVLVSNQISNDETQGPVYATFNDQTGTITLTSISDLIQFQNDCSGMFAGMTDLAYVDGSAFAFRQVDLNLTNMFKDCTSLRTINGINNWFNAQSLSDITTGDFTSMFENCSQLTADCGQWDVAIADNDITTEQTFNYNAPGVTPPTWTRYHNYTPGTQL